MRGKVLDHPHLLFLARPYKHTVGHRLHLQTQTKFGTHRARSRHCSRHARCPTEAIADCYRRWGHTVETSKPVDASATAAARASSQRCLGARRGVHVSGRL